MNNLKSHLIFVMLMELKTKKIAMIAIISRRDIDYQLLLSQKNSFEKLY